METRRQSYFSLQFSLRTLVFLMLLAGPLGGWGWVRWQEWKEWQARQEARQLREEEYASLVARGGIVDQSWTGPDPAEATRSDESFPESDPRPR